MLLIVAGWRGIDLVAAVAGCPRSTRDSVVVRIGTDRSLQAVSHGHMFTRRLSEYNIRPHPTSLHSSGIVRGVEES